MPNHLRRGVERKSPGPGWYEAPSSIKASTRPKESGQDSTWAKVAGGSFIDIPKNNPGPGQYETHKEIISARPKSLEPGFAMQNGPKDAMLRDVLRNLNPGAGEYEFPAMHTFSHNKSL